MPGPAAETTLREGDVVVLRGTRLVSAAIGCASSGWSHAALVVVFGGEVCFCHATPNPARLEDVVAEEPIGGVTLTRARDEIASGFYAAGAVCRPAKAAVTAAAARAYLARSYGLPYEKNPCAVLCASGCCGDGIETTESVFCTELVATVLGIGPVHGIDPGRLLDLLPYVGKLRLPSPRFGAYLCNVHQSPALPEDEAARLRAVAFGAHTVALRWIARK